MNNFKIVPIMGFSVFCDDLEKISLNPNTKTVINTINAHSFVLSQDDMVFKQALLQSQILLPDGISIVFASFFLKSTKIKKVAGYDLFTYLLHEANKLKTYRIMFLGSSEHVLALIKKKMHIEFSNIEIYTYSPPFKDIFSSEENDRMIEYINLSNPDALFVGMTAPKQEKWIFDHFDRIDVNLICSIGAVFDFYAETVKRPPSILVNAGLEWLGRFLSNPKKMWKRNLVSNTKFVYYFCRVLFLRLFNKTNSYF